MPRHIGKLKNTDTRVVVIYMQIPDAENFSLVVETDALHEQYHDPLMRIVENEGQHDICLADTLGRLTLGDMGRNALEVLHYLGALRKVPVENVKMYPNPNQGIDLVELLRIMGKNVPSSRVAERIDEGYNEYKENVWSENSALDTTHDKSAIAKNLIIQAKMLEDEALSKRRQAYEMAPELKPVERVAPSIPTPVVTETSKPAKKPATASLKKAAETVPVKTTGKRGRPAKAK